MSQFVNIEAELDTSVLFLTLGISDGVERNKRNRIDGTLWEFAKDGGVSGVAMAVDVTDIVSKRADCERELLDTSDVAEEINDEVTRANVMGNVGHIRLARLVIAGILDESSTISVRAGVEDLFFRSFGEIPAQYWDDGGFPSDINDHLVGENAIGLSTGWRYQREHKNECGCENSAECRHGCEE